MKRWIGTAVMVLGMAGLAAGRVESDPNKDYAIAPEAGRWFICAASFKGDDAAQLAKELALVIRRDFHLPAYVFDRGKDEWEKQFKQWQELRQKCPDGRFRITRIGKHHAVLVGGYKDMDAARRALDSFKKLQPPDKFCYSGVQEEPTPELKEYIRSGGMKALTGKEGVWVKQVRDNPFAFSFVVHNPTLPREQEDDLSKADPFLRKLNAGESLSLLNCRKPWTLVVANFTGPMMIQSRETAAGGGNRFLEMLGLGNKARDMLDAGAMQAQSLAKALREMKPVAFESYVLHTKHSSVVTIGSYDSPNDPKMQSDQMLWSKLNLQVGTGAGGRLPGLLPQPLPMQVPKP